MGKQEEYRQNLYRIAKNIIGQFKISSEAFSAFSDAKAIARSLYASHGDTLKSGMVRLNWGPGTLAEIGFAGRGAGNLDGVTLHDVHGKDWLNQVFNGESLVREIALTSLVAAMADILWGNLLRQRMKQKTVSEEDRIKCAFCEKTFPKFFKGKGRDARSGLLPLAAHIDEEHPEQAEIIEQYMSIQENLLRK